MKSRQIFACLLGATLLLQSSTAIYAKPAEEKKVLTLESAIDKAKSRSLQISLNDKQTYLAKENAEIANLMGGYFAANGDRVKYEYAQKQKSVLEDQMTLSVTNLYENIILSARQLENLEETIELQQKQYKRDEIQFQNGLKSDLYMQQKQYEIAQNQSAKDKLTQDLQLKYLQLGDLVGLTMEYYTLEAPDLVYEPFKDVPNIELYAKSKAEEHIDAWKAAEDLRVALETPIFTTDYMQAITLKTNRDIAKTNQTMTTENLEAAIRETYMQAKQLEQQYTILSQDVILKEKQIQVNKIYLEKGMISQLEYDQSQNAYENALLKLEEVIVRHNALKYQLTHPNLISAIRGM